MTQDPADLFAACLTELRDAAGSPSLNTIVNCADRMREPVEIGASTLSHWFNGKAVPRPGPAVDFLLGLLHQRAARRGSDVPAIEEYRRLHEAAWQHANRNRGGRPPGKAFHVVSPPQDTQARLRDEEFRRHFLPRAMAGNDTSGNGEHGWWFTGRHRALTDISRWLARPDPAVPCTVVTAAPGSGKTALLGMIVALTRPDRRSSVPVAALGLPKTALPDVGTVDIAVYAKGLTGPDVLAGLAAAAGVAAVTPRELVAALNSAGSRLTAVIDALDEADDPPDLIGTVLRPLLNEGPTSVRLLLGTRPYLLNLLPGTISRINLDADYADAEAIRAYSRRGLLEASPRSPYLTAGEETTSAVAAGVADAAGASFLVARIVSRSLSDDAATADPTDPGWRAGLPLMLDHAVGWDLERLGEHTERARDLLRPLAYAEGSGLPWEDIWAPLASRIAGRELTDEDVHWLRTTAGSYLSDSRATRHTAFRLYHEALAEHLRQDVDRVAVHQAFTEVLSAAVPRRPDGSPDWSRAHPYTLENLATHAARAGQLDSLVTDVGYLAHAVPETLIRALPATVGEAARHSAAAYRASAYMHHRLTARERRQMLALDAARLGLADLREAAGAELEWRTRWTSGRADITLRATTSAEAMAVGCWVRAGRPIAVTGFYGPLLQVWDLQDEIATTLPTCHESYVNAIVCATLADGREVAVTGGADTHVRVVDLADGAEIAALAGHTSAVSALARTVLGDGRQALVSGGSDGTVRLWDLETGRGLAVLVGHSDYIASISCTSVDGRAVAVTSSGDHTVAVWDLDAGRRISLLRTGMGMMPDRLLCAAVDGRPIVVTGSSDGMVRTWDLATGDQLDTFENEDEVRGMDGIVVDGQPLLVTATGSGAVEVWDLGAGTPIAVLEGHTEHASDVACTVLDGRASAVSVGNDGTLRVWELPTRPRASAAPGHRMTVEALACGALDGVPVAISGSWDKTLVWDLGTGRSVGSLDTTTSGEVQFDKVDSLACTVLDGRSVLVTGNLDGEPRTWDLSTGAPISLGLPPAVDTSGALVCTSDWGYPAAIIGGHGGSAWICDLATGQVRQTLSGHTDIVFAVAWLKVDGRPVVLTGSRDLTGRVWDAETGACRYTLTGHTGFVRAVAVAEFSGVPVGFTGGNDGRVVGWDLRTGHRIAVLGGHQSPVTVLASAAGSARTALFSGSYDGTVRVWTTLDGRAGTVIAHLSAGVEAIAVDDSGVLVVAAGREVVCLTGWDQGSRAVTRAASPQDRVKPAPPWP
jgi:WD40 repeat protein